MNLINEIVLKMNVGAICTINILSPEDLEGHQKFDCQIVG